MLNTIDPLYAKTDNEILKEFGEMLKQWRINSNLTQQEFADAIGISVNHLSKIERTGKTTLSTLLAASRQLRLLQQLLEVYTPPDLTPMQQYEIEQGTSKIEIGRKRVKS
jgi:transcriptional regulator with XRE-family HTH domain